MIKSDPAFPSQTAQPRISAISPSAMLWLRWAMVSSSSADTLSSLYPLWTANSEMTSARFLPNCYRLRQSAARADTPQGWQRNRLRPSCGRTAARPGHSVSRISGTPFPAPVETSATVQQHLQNFQLVVQKARRIVTVNAIAGEKAVNRAVQTLFSVVQEEAEAQQLRENERLCFSVLSNYARVLRRWSGGSLPIRSWEVTLAL